MTDMETRSEHQSFGGTTGFYTHQSSETGTAMNFAVFTPPQAKMGKVPALFYLAGLTCTEETFMTKAGAQTLASALGMALIAPDTSPRDANLPGEDDDYDFGTGAGFYLNAEADPWAKHYRMFAYVTEELPALITENFPIEADRLGVFGHSMGGHGALVCHLKRPDLFKTVSAFAPIAAPTRCPWGHKAFSNYLGPDQETWKQWDASELAATSASKASILVDQGLSDGFLAEQLYPEAFEEACAASNRDLTLRRHDGYDHGYYFISTFMGDHLRHHVRDL
jgi:S-formylglutathione hydrolase